MTRMLDQREALLRQQLDAVEARLHEAAEAIRRDGLTVRGSRKQPRPNPLLREERELRRERARASAELALVVERLEDERRLAKQLEEANALTRWVQDAAIP
jgi:hypothetical protein